MNHGETLRKIRLNKNLSQENMAKAIEITQASYSEWEHKPYIKEEKLIKACFALGITLEDFYKQEDAFNTNRANEGGGAEFNAFIFNIMETQKEMLLKMVELEEEIKRLKSEQGSKFRNF
jgi:transcriptional regulator with XRE-family HTH domain